MKEILLLLRLISCSLGLSSKQNKTREIKYSVYRNFQDKRCYLFQRVAGDRKKCDIIWKNL